MINKVAQILTLVLLAAGMTYAGNSHDQDGAAPPNSATEMAKADASSSQPPANVPQLQQRNPRYQVQKGDVIVLDFPSLPNSTKPSPFSRMVSSACEDWMICT